jgi:hypothetical protein
MRLQTGVLRDERYARIGEQRIKAGDNGLEGGCAQGLSG